MSFIGEAAAGAWTQTEGDGIAIVTTGRRMAPVGALTGGPIDSEANVSQVYLEYGVIDGLTVGAKSYFELSSTDLTAGSAAIGGFLRKRVWDAGKGGVGSLEAGYAHPVESLLGRTFDFVDPGAVPEAYAAALYGHGWAAGLAEDWGSAFVSTGAAYYWRGAETADDLRFEITGGYAPWRRFMGVVSVYGLMPLGPGTDPSLKVAPSIAVTLWPWIGRNEKKPKGRVTPSTIQLGASYDLLNRDDGIGITLSIWRRF